MIPRIPISMIAISILIVLLDKAEKTFGNHCIDTLETIFWMIKFVLCLILALSLILIIGFAIISFVLGGDVPW